MLALREVTDSIVHGPSGNPRLVLSPTSTTFLDVARACSSKGEELRAQVEWLQSPPYRFLAALSRESMDLVFALVLQRATRALGGIVEEAPELKALEQALSSLFGQCPGWYQAEGLRENIRRGKGVQVLATLDEVSGTGVWIFNQTVENFILQEIFQADSAFDCDRQGLREGEIGFVASPYGVTRFWTSCWQGGPAHLVDVGAGDGCSGVLGSLCIQASKTTLIECHRARAAQAAGLIGRFNLANVEVVAGRANGKAPAVMHAYESGTIFYFYRPFEAAILSQVLSNIRSRSTNRPVSIVSFLYEAEELHAESGWLRPVRLKGAPAQLFVHCANGAERFWRQSVRQ